MAILDWINLRALLHQISVLTNWKVLAIIFALLNLKSLPFAWHVSRLIPSLILQANSINLPRYVA